jgi:hypothetical protein
MVYQPTLELLAYLRARGFKTFIVSGGGIEFMRPWTEKVYGVPPEQIVGSTFLMVVITRLGDLIHKRQHEAHRRCLKKRFRKLVGGQTPLVALIHSSRHELCHP